MSGLIARRRTLAQHRMVRPFNWTYDKLIKMDGELYGKTGGMVSDYIEITPNIPYTIISYSEGVVICCDYKDDFSFNDFWSYSSSEEMEFHFYKRTINSPGAKYVRIHTDSHEHKDMLKVWQNGVLLFDGSWYD